MSGKFKLWHVIIIVAGVAALAWGAWRVFSSGRSQAEWASSVYGMDVLTGEVYQYNMSQGGVVFPAVSPDTNERTVIPVAQDPESGEWYFDPRFSDFVREFGPRAKAVTDISARKVKVAGEPKRVQR